MEIAEALDLAHEWLRSQTWWSDDQDAIVSATRADGTWVVCHAPRQWLETGDDLDLRIGGMGPVTVTDDGHILSAEPDCQVPPDIQTVGELAERAIRLAGLDPADIIGRKTCEN